MAAREDHALSAYEAAAMRACDAWEIHEHVELRRRFQAARARGDNEPNFHWAMLD
jgi:hypothetical protein